MNHLRKKSSGAWHSMIAVVIMFSMVAASFAVVPDTAQAKKAKVSSVKMISKTMVVAPGKT
ncbi:MAG: hypothetical protein LBR68_03995 [Lachnoclostridium sp.]|jgi:hypothetical protein|nr:hypothetical protein [Lachnoclostridium sp.]